MNYSGGRKSLSWYDLAFQYDYIGIILWLTIDKEQLIYANYCSQQMTCSSKIKNTGSGRAGSV